MKQKNNDPKGLMAYVYIGGGVAFLLGVSGDLLDFRTKLVIAGMVGSIPILMGLWLGLKDKKKDKKDELARDVLRNHLSWRHMRNNLLSQDSDILAEAVPKMEDYMVSMLRQTLDAHEKHHHRKPSAEEGKAYIEKIIDQAMLKYINADILSGTGAKMTMNKNN